MEFHEYAGIYDLLEGAEFDALVEDIKANGLRLPIILHTDGRILDGRNRYRACAAAGVEPRYEQWDGVGLACDFVRSLNHSRRHLTVKQTQFSAARYAVLREEEAVARGRANLRNCSAVSIDTTEDYGRSREKAAELFGVPTATVARTMSVVKHGTSELIHAAEFGKVSVSAAADVATLPKEQQTVIVARGEKEILEAAKAIRADKAETRRQERIEKITEIARGNTDLNISKRYPIIYCDPPWRYEHSISESRAIENQYPTMALEEICALPVADIAFDDCVLFMWATSPKLEESMRVLNAWGFTYKTCAVWDKQKIGMGYYFRQRHELLLVATKGAPTTPAPSERPESVFSFLRGEHSAKPAEVAEMIESMYPDFERVELFCRTPREGWDVWGNQSYAA